MNVLNMTSMGQSLGHILSSGYLDFAYDVEACFAVEEDTDSDVPVTPRLHPCVSIKLQIKQCTMLLLIFGQHSWAIGCSSLCVT
jgi:hypothetical protein